MIWADKTKFVHFLKEIKMLEIISYGSRLNF